MSKFFTGSNDSIGGFAENLALTILSRPVRGQYRRPLFKPVHLGEKYPVVDLFVAVLDSKENFLGYFFAQVKSTQTADAASSTLPLTLDLQKFNKLAAIPIPTFLIGIDVKSETAFLVAATGVKRKAFSSITKRHDLLDERILTQLYKEVVKFWEVNAPRLDKTQSLFHNER